MTYNPATDFIGLFRAISGGVEKAEMPGLDFVIVALARAGIITVQVDEMAPVANQSITAWFQPAVPSYIAEGAFFLWDANASAYAAATPFLLTEMLAAVENAEGRSVAISLLLDTIGMAEGDILVRGAGAWSALGPGTAGYLLTTHGASALPTWTPPGSAVNIQTLLDSIGNTEGDILVRGASAWQAPGAGTAAFVWTSNGPGSVPTWQAVGSGGSGVTSLGGATGVIGIQSGMSVSGNVLQFMQAGTLTTFQQTTAPLGWTKAVVHDDKALRVVSGTASSGGSSPFSTVFAQTGTAGHALSQAELPAFNLTVTDPGHVHPLPDLADAASGMGTEGVSVGTPTNTGSAVTGITVSSGGSDTPHSHTMDIRVEYVDLIIASKDA